MACAGGTCGGMDTMRDAPDDNDALPRVELLEKALEHVQKELQLIKVELRKAMRAKESGWAKLPAWLMAKVLEALPAAEQSAPEAGGGWGGCGASATVRLVSSQWKDSHDALVTGLRMRPGANGRLGTTDDAVRAVIK